jgi:very-short-patch-repair endonuclease
VGVQMAPSGIRPETISKAKLLRKSMTQGEAKLWRELRDWRRLYGIHVRRQAPVGPYIADFAIHDRKTLIEVDGEHHFKPDRILQDQKRDAWLVSQGFRVLRFNTGELEQSFDGCVEEIMREIGLI